MPIEVGCLAKAVAAAVVLVAPRTGSLPLAMATGVGCVLLSRIFFSGPA